MKSFTSGLTASRLEQMLEPYMKPDDRSDEQSDRYSAVDAGEDRHDLRASEAHPRNGSAVGPSGAVSR